MLVDAHVHIWKTEQCSSLLGFSRDTPDVDFEKMMQDYDEAGFDKIVVLTQSMERIHAATIGTSELAAEFQRKYPKKVIGLAGTEPLDRQGRLNVEGLEHFRKAIQEYGLKGLMMSPGYGQWYPNEKGVYPFYQLAVELDVPIYFHMATWWSPAVYHPLRYGRPYLFDDALLDFPDLKINIEHMGYPWTEEVLTLMSRFKNVYTDISQLIPSSPISLKGPLTLTWKLAQAKELGVLDKVIYGSDMTPMGADLKKEIAFIRGELNHVAAGCGLPAFSGEEIDGILGNNAARLFRLE